MNQTLSESQSIEIALGKIRFSAISEEKSAEQQARDMLERMGVERAQEMTSGDLVELANLIARCGPGI